MTVDAFCMAYIPWTSLIASGRGFLPAAHHIKWVSVGEIPPNTNLCPQMYRKEKSHCKADLCVPTMLNAANRSRSNSSTEPSSSSCLQMLSVKQPEWFLSHGQGEIQIGRGPGLKRHLSSSGEFQVLYKQITFFPFSLGSHACC